ncbi:UDP-galactopyranose mutase [Pacificibacter maritimus]|uniref:UDP-galactopyranose mutase n=1 Tax=Pacificibacter maritimus TaxID=762213 RepID=A0A3N4UMZ5_9RHOB|nr:UDP-galactopyranose mutase [Pacificibacter maritimus]RPE66427.1 UDP-galactopyranose mutase [Pacificibacter maritimus]
MANSLAQKAPPRGRVLGIGAGLTCSVIGRELAEAGYQVDIIESRPYVAGNCYTEVDDQTGITLHKHGPHIFHTDNDTVWDYVNQYADFRPYTCQVKATTGGRVFSLPINLLTINQFFNQTFSPTEAEAFIAEKSRQDITDVKSFEDQALRFLGQELYEAFFKGYPIKQWGMHPSELPASVLKRLPVRFNYNDNYFNHRHQGIPAEGYTTMVDKILDHENISVTLGRKVTQADCDGYDHVFCSGPIDAWFNYELGQLGYRTLDFEITRHKGDYQGCAVMSYPDESVPFTRITEHKHFTPWETHDDTVIFHEFSRVCGKEDIPYYPIRLVNETNMLRNYVEHAQSQENLSFVGRLGSYKYMDMDVTIAEALEAAKMFLSLRDQNAPIPTFFAPPV